MRSTTNRTRPYKPKKRKPVELGALKKIPMSWIGTGTQDEERKQDDEISDSKTKRLWYIPASE